MSSAEMWKNNELHRGLGEGFLEGVASELDLGS